MTEDVLKLLKSNEVIEKQFKNIPSISVTPDVSNLVKSIFIIFDKKANIKFRFVNGVFQISLMIFSFSIKSPILFTLLVL